ncbi:MAG: DUF1295 domain-containing protein [Candidatus Hydrogenedentes bacterium]|nr:DUF1295 domain-containing protein [Candidatus Hydrogenedentota bacterium]
MSRRFQVVYAIFYGVLTHMFFAISVAIMVRALYHGLNTGWGSFHGWTACIANALLVVQFPLIHSLMLTPWGHSLMAKAAPAGLGKDLAPTTYVLIASLQLMLAFVLWSPSGIVFIEPHGTMFWMLIPLYLASWTFLVKALTDAGLGLQMGYMGWLSVVRGKRPDYGSFPTHGLFRVCRHPVYLGFALVLWTSPIVTLDGVLLACAWTFYCLVGPLFKQKRYAGWYGERFAQYCASVPYMLPRLRVRRDSKSD